MVKKILYAIALILALVVGLYSGHALDKYRVYKMKTTNPEVMVIQTATQSYVITAKASHTDKDAKRLKEIQKKYVRVKSMVTKQVNKAVTSLNYVDRRTDNRRPVQFIEAKPKGVRKPVEK